ncbi:S-adenosyl-L-methionine-dependent methyltransferase [Delitschia confertaspora ATCC 74209]|uniref:S-adenosyl-L-methionine-dependent methyltransferase n=1 Tax=Delitschia confertaspora ATCC 74209 TaxID=1513339 RepID=A0A9P4JU18_9PLEO|nr:S-adenosyl-L-methionine-dependent methyltransferase [Delitschia confertaspora ATCC 74209]
MEEEPPPPDDPAKDNTAAHNTRERTGSDVSSTTGSLVSTRTLRSEDITNLVENGRTYANETYHMPCDQEEQDRLAILHQVYVNALRGELTTTKITPSVKRILDLGTGPGEWAVAMARKYPHAEVVAIDLAVWDLEATEGSPPTGRVTWEIDDLDVWLPNHELEDLTSHLGTLPLFGGSQGADSPQLTAKWKGKVPQTAQPRSPGEAASFDSSVQDPSPDVGWHFSEPFDFIHLRGLKGAFAYWEDVYAEIYNSLKPGGSVEVVDWEMPLGPDHFLPNIKKLYKSMMTASFKCGRPLGTSHMHPTYLEDAGFKDVRTTYVNVPVGTWSDDPEQKKIGKMWMVVLIESLEPHCLRLLTKHGDVEKVWTKEEVREAVEAGKREILEWEGRVQKREVEGWVGNFKWMVGRKPV